MIVGGPPGRGERDAASFEFLHLDNCGHAPHRDQPEAVLKATVRLLDAV